MNTANKVYAIVLEDRLRRDVKGKGIISETHAGFREGWGAIDDIYALQHMVDRKLGKKGANVYAFFIDLKRAFPSVDRGRVWEAMQDRRMERGIIERVRDVYKETKGRERGEEGISDGLWMDRGLMQGYPISQKLFAVLIADMES
ncbi:uncharacterized protein LOC117178533 [Belonocnema kinseyi]|uniref:uncharacterized protein LOC117178533 n=1 Tax=Belonocnema kinseyi TaxID=2817044 RepID=UPI00143DCA62|nr:uncharacterized protein LOC117178533 [Belonocnema kinseyi]